MDAHDRIGDAIRLSLTALRDLGDEEVAGVLERLEEAGVPEAVKAVRVLREKPATREGLVGALATLWREGLRARVEARLRELRGE